jgi:hypothetical protein
LFAAANCNIVSTLNGGNETISDSRSLPMIAKLDVPATPPIIKSASRVNFLASFTYSLIDPLGIIHATKPG